MRRNHALGIRLPDAVGNAGTQVDRRDRVLRLPALSAVLCCAGGPPRPEHRVKPLAITSFGIASSLGQGNAAAMRAIREHRSGLRPNDLEGVELETWIGRVPELES